MSICTRKRDLAYLLFFVTHVPIILRMILYLSSYLDNSLTYACTLTLNIVIDTVPLLPTFLQANLSHTLREFYITTYRDKFFEDPPTWFTVFIWMELLYHLPLSIWATRGLLKGIFLTLPFFPKLVLRTYITSYMLLCISLYPVSVHPPTSHLIHYISISNAISGNLTTYLHTLFTPNRESHHQKKCKTKKTKTKTKTQ